MKKNLILVIILLAIIGIPVAKKLFKPDSAKEVKTQAVGKRIIKASVLASGQLKHENQVKLSAEVIGKVSKLYVVEGQKVSKGQVVLEIDDQEYTSALEQQKAVVDQQKIAIERQQLVVLNMDKQLSRKRKLFEQKLLDKDAYESALHQYKVAEVDLKVAREQLKQSRAALEQANDRLLKTKVTSPIDGRITSLDIKVGETAIAGTTNIAGSSLMTIADPDSMLAEIRVDEADIANIQVGQNAEIIAIAYDNKPIKGQVLQIASSAKQAQGRQSLSFAVKLALSEESKSLNLRPGMSCRAEVFTRGEQELLAVPLRALRTKEDNDSDSVENYVFIADGDLAKKVAVQAGVSDDSFQQIIEGLDIGAQVITGPDKILRHLKDGDKISATLQDGNNDAAH
ncbi:efflux RND transporter periplasmic adaptor subunit [Aliikangiella sp. G2MR2-5]|uniref:efflux RND transporter periplasmic adaptor subunit n=1 Tax=Aliikangiella sp. G2MR2-5 TaxID=2788943 RepID=UPI0018AC8163|nr:efflux RND transporter periplasmic adaptor subunit [Aliikangiella sp. G2MR2-5]